MGTFSNIQLYLPQANESQVRQIADCIISLQAENGLEPSPNASGAERSVLISALKGAWTGIYEDKGEDATTLKKLAAELSAYFKTSALAIMVRNCQNLSIGLFQNGSNMSMIENANGYANFWNTKAEPWKAVLKNGYFFEDLEKAWKEGELFVQDYLERISPILGLYPDHIMKSYQTMLQEKAAVLRSLHFKKAQPAAAME